MTPWRMHAVFMSLFQEAGGMKPEDGLARATVTVFPIIIAA